MIARNVVTEFVEKVGPYSHITEVNNIVSLSGIIAYDDISADENSFASISSETATCLSLIKKMLISVGLSIGDLTSVLIHMTDLSEFDKMNVVYRTFFQEGSEPSRTCVGVANLLNGARIEITCQAVRKEGYS